MIRLWDEGDTVGDRGQDALRRNNVRITGNPDGQPILFVHGFGGSQETWHAMTPEFEADYRVILMDHVGSGDSDVSAYDRAKYDSLHGYVDDLLEIIETLTLHDVVFVGHSVSALMGVLAVNRAPELFDRLVLVGPSPRYIDADGYVGGFSQEAIDDLLNSLDSNYLGWSSTMASTLMGNAERPELRTTLEESIRTIDPAIASQFARVTFLSDNRRDLADVTVPALVLQSTEDVIASYEVGKYVHENIPNSEFVLMESRGHLPNLSHPAEVSRHIKAFLG